MFQEFLNYHANIETQSLKFENDKPENSPPNVKPGVRSGYL